MEHLLSPDNYFYASTVVFGFFAVLWSKADVVEYLVKLTLGVLAALNIVAVVKCWPPEIPQVVNAFVFGAGALYWTNKNALNIVIKIVFSVFALWGFCQFLMS